MDYCLAYFSTAVGQLREKDILEIVEQSRTKNARLGITGVLLFIKGSIVQVLEGEQAAVEALYECIRVDPRHTDVETVLSRPIAHRLFPDWHMGYETLTTQHFREVRHIINLELKETSFFDSDEPVILRMLKLFLDLNHPRASK